MIPVIAAKYTHYKEFLKKNRLSHNKYYYVDNPEKLMGIERGSILLMYETYRQHPKWEEIIRWARHRNLDCINVF